MQEIYSNWKGIEEYKEQNGGKKCRNENEPEIIIYVFLDQIVFKQLNDKFKDDIGKAEREASFIRLGDNLNNT